MAIKIGANSVSALYVGASPITKVYLGSDLVADTGGSGGGYVAKAVHFDGSTCLARGAGLIGWNTASKLICSGWYKGLQENNHNIFSSYPNQYVGAAVDSGNGIFDSTDYGSPSGSIKFTSDGSLGANWNNIVYAGDLTDETKNAIYLNGVLVADGSTFQAGGLTFGLDEENNFFIGQDGYNGFQTGDFSDFYLALGQWIDLSVPANLAKFIAAGKPVDLGADGSGPTGVAPTVFCSGDASGFATNKGAGGMFTLTGTLTNATTSPSD